jgi:hypothetical protein
VDFTFFQQQKKGTKKCRAYSKKPENLTFFLKTVNSLLKPQGLFLFFNSKKKEPKNAALTENS